MYMVPFSFSIMVAVTVLSYFEVSTFISPSISLTIDFTVIPEPIIIAEKIAKKSMRTINDLVLIGFLTPLL